MDWSVQIVKAVEIQLLEIRYVNVELVYFRDSSLPSNEVDRIWFGLSIHCFCLHCSPDVIVISYTE